MESGTSETRPVRQVTERLGRVFRDTTPLLHRAAEAWGWGKRPPSRKLLQQAGPLQHPSRPPASTSHACWSLFSEVSPSSTGEVSVTVSGPLPLPLSVVLTASVYLQYFSGFLSHIFLPSLFWAVSPRGGVSVCLSQELSLSLPESAPLSPCLCTHYCSVAANRIHSGQ